MKTEKFFMIAGMILSFLGTLILAYLTKGVSPGEIIFSANSFPGLTLAKAFLLIGVGFIFQLIGTFLD